LREEQVLNVAENWPEKLGARGQKSGGPIKTGKKKHPKKQRGPCLGLTQQQPEDRKRPRRIGVVEKVEREKRIEVATKGQGEAKP